VVRTRERDRSVAATDQPLTIDSLNYWEHSLPWAFKGEQRSYLEKRKMRYGLQDYMLGDIAFNAYEGKRLLEIGSGGGIDSAEFGVHGAEVVSLDFTQSGTITTRKLMMDAGLVPRPIRAAATILPFKDNQFDCVYSFGALHHVEDVSDAIVEIARVLKSNGDLICMVYNRNSLLYAYSILFLHKEEGLSEPDLLRKYSERNYGCPFTRAFTEEEVVALLKPFFTGIDIKVRFNAIDMQNERKVKFNIDENYELGWHLLVHATRK
jgi:ubiquinone/menaquinone biosynthesis C-methylase UbiE